MSSFGSRLAACCADCDNPNPEASFEEIPIVFLQSFHLSLNQVRAYYFAGFGRSGLFMTFNFLVSAVIHFAYLDAGCVRYGDEAFGDDGNFDDGEKSSFYEKGWEGSSNGSGSKPVECMGTVLGLKPSSIVSVLATVGGLVAMFGMPLAGSIIDATDKRQEFGAASAAVLVVSNAVQVFITQDTWLVMVIIQVSKSKSLNLRDGVQPGTISLLR
jgi:MFS-type transporter involved in bile tolerance (Atg22 family)